VRVLFWGTPEFAVPTLRALGEEGHTVVGVVTQPDRPAGRGRSLRPSAVSDMAEAEGIPVLKPERPVGAAFLDELRALDPQVSVVVAYGHILRPEVLDLPPHGSINVHASLLPELRGAAPVHWAIARGFETTGVTIMRMSEGMDAGPILQQVEVPIDPEENSTELAARLSEVGAQALVQTLALLEAGLVDEREQDHEAATFAPKVSRGVARIDWMRPAREVCDHVRAMDSVPGAWSELDGEPVKLFRPQVGARGDDVAAAPGVVIDAEAGSGRGLGVATGEGTVWFDEVQPPGRRRMAVEAWLVGRGVAEGARFV
jgi:methionyl-tRNA formyltransferase